MFIHNINPIFFQIGHFQIRYYGLVWVLGFLLAYYFLNRNREKLELTKDELEKYIIYLIFGVFIGARIVHVLFSDFSYYASNLSKIFAFWEGGVAFHGGLLGAVLVSYYFFKKKNIGFYQIADVLVVPAAIALTLGRVANFINGELWGTITDVSWCVQFLGIESCRHPSQLYEALANFFILGVVFFLGRNYNKKGFIFWVFVLLMGISRFLISFFRVDDKFLSLSDGQYFSLIMVVVSLYILWKRYRKYGN